MPLLAAAFSYVAFPPLSWWPLIFVSFIPFFLFVIEEGNWKRFILGSFIFFGLYSTLTAIFVLDPALMLWGELLWFIVSLPFFYLIKRFVRRPGYRFLSVALVCAAAFSVVANFSLLPAYIIMPGLPLANTPFQFVALLGGLTGATLFVMLINASGAAAVWFWTKGSSSRAYLSALLFALLLLCGFALQFAAAHKASMPLTVMAVSTGENFDLAVKALDDRAAKEPEKEATLKAMIQALLAPIGTQVEARKPDLVVFPEEMIDVRLPGISYQKAKDQIGVTNSGYLLEEYAAFAVVHKVDLLATLVTFDTDGKKYISTISINKNGDFTGIYHKRLLTIVGEYWPFGQWLPFWWRWELKRYSPTIEQESFITDNPTGPYTRGSDAQRPFSIGGVSIGSLICLEGHYPGWYGQWEKQGVQMFVFSGSNRWLNISRDLYSGLLTRIRQMESIRTGLPVVVSSSEESPIIIFPNGTIAEGEKASSWSFSYVVR